MPNTVNNNIIDIDLSATRKKTIRIDGDDDRIIQINLSDMSLPARFEAEYPKLSELSFELRKFDDNATMSTDDSELALLNAKIKELDTAMRECVDRIFDSNVCDACAPDGTMVDMFNGRIRFEYIIETLMGLYEDTIQKETNKMMNQMKKHTDKYTK